MSENEVEDGRHFFWLADGRALRSLRELADALPSLRDDLWNHHVTPEKNDFADWVRDVFHEYRLSEALRRAKSRQEFQQILYNELARRMMAAQRETREQARHEREEAILHDPAAFKQYREDDAKKKDALADRFDAVAARITESLHPETPEAVEHRLEALEERLQELEERISAARRQGRDLFIADLLLRPARAKIAYAKVSHEEADFAQVENIFTEVEREIEDALHSSAPDVKLLAAAKGDV